MPGHYAIGVDLGGTKIATGLTDFEGKILARQIVPTRAEEGTEAVVERIKETIRTVMRAVDAVDSDILGIGICCPGPLDPETGVVIFAPNLGWNHVPISAYIVEEFCIPTYIENDANAAALAEKWFGAGQDAEHLLYITVSTGVGGGIILNGEIYRGRDFMAGEIGHTIVLPEGGVQCGCGQFGCLETIASGTAIGRQGREAAADEPNSLLKELAGSIAAIDARVVASAAAQGDKTAQRVLDRSFLYLGIFIANMLNVLNVEKVVIGGGVSKMGDVLFDALRRVVDRRMADVPAKHTPIVPAQTGDNVGILGSVGLVLKASLHR